jgi:hypothetical protein
MAFTYEQLKAIRDQHDAWLRQQPGIQGSAIGSGAIEVFTDQATEEIKKAVQVRLKDCPVLFKETGRIRPLRLQQPQESE